MKQNLSGVEQELVNELVTELMEKCQISETKAHDMIENSTFYHMLKTAPEFTFHESVEGWVRIVLHHNK